MRTAYYLLSFVDCSDIQGHFFPSLLSDVNSDMLDSGKLCQHAVVVHTKICDFFFNPARSTLLRERLVELEIEIERFKKENAALSRLRQENQEFQENLRYGTIQIHKGCFYTY